jgi:hypothetical protein
LSCPIHAKKEQGGPYPSCFIIVIVIVSVVGGCGVCSANGDGHSGGGSRVTKGDVCVMGDAGWVMVSRTSLFY